MSCLQFCLSALLRTWHIVDYNKYLLINPRGKDGILGGYTQWCSRIPGSRITPDGLKVLLYRVPGIKLGSATCKLSALPAILSLQSLILFYFFSFWITPGYVQGLFLTLYSGIILSDSRGTRDSRDQTWVRNMQGKYLNCQLSLQPLLCFCGSYMKNGLWIEENKYFYISFLIFCGVGGQTWAVTHTYHACMHSNTSFILHWFTILQISKGGNFFILLCVYNIHYSNHKFQWHPSSHPLLLPPISSPFSLLSNHQFLPRWLKFCKKT